MMVTSLNMTYPCWNAPPSIILLKQLLELSCSHLPRHFFFFSGNVNFPESASAFNSAHSPKVARPITKSSRAVAKQSAQAEILKKGTTPAF